MLWLIPSLWTGWTPQLGLMVKDSFPVPQKHSESNFCGSYLEAQGTKEHFRTMPNAGAHAAPVSVQGKRKHVRDWTRRTCDLATRAKPQNSCLALLARMAYALPHGESGWCRAQLQRKPRATTASYWQLPARSFWMSRRSARNPPVLSLNFYKFNTNERNLK